jgi:hypothetical protein
MGMNETHSLIDNIQECPDTLEKTTCHTTARKIMMWIRKDHQQRSTLGWHWWWNPQWFLTHKNTPMKIKKEQGANEK